jgi:hypothetical protein
MEPTPVGVVDLNPECSFSGTVKTAAGTLIHRSATPRNFRPLHTDACFVAKATRLNRKTGNRDYDLKSEQFISAVLRLRGCEAVRFRGPEFRINDCVSLVVSTNASSCKTTGMPLISISVPFSTLVIVI